MKHTTFKNIFFSALLCLLALLSLVSCGDARKKKVNTASLELDVGIGFSHFDNESDYPAPSSEAYLDVYSSKIIIRNAYGDKIIETPLIYNNSSTAHPRMKLSISGNRMYVVYCPDISLPNLQIASSDNGGKSWIQSTLNLPEDKVGTIDNFTASFWSSKNGALIISNGMVDTFIYFTDDAGKTWRESENAPPSQNWHDSLYRGAFLSPAIGFASYNYYSFPPSEPQIYLTLDGGASWNNMGIKVPTSVMENYALAGTPFYDGEKINVPIELYDVENELVNTVYYVSYDFGDTWKFYAEEEEELQLIRNTESEKWFSENRPQELSEEKYFVSDFSLYSSFHLEEGVRIDAYKFVAAYDIKDWSRINLTGDMYFDEDANFFFRDSSGFPILIFIYEGDVFSHTYSLMASSGEKQFLAEGEERISKRLYEEYCEQRAIKKLFADAEEAYSWFKGYSSGGISGDELMEYNGKPYDRLSFTQLLGTEISNLNQLEDYLSTMFSEEIVLTLMESTVMDGGKEYPLICEDETGLGRFGGYAAMTGYNVLTPRLTVLKESSDSILLRIEVNKEFYEKNIEFTYDYELFLDSDGFWKFKSFVLPIEKAWEINKDLSLDKSEAAIYHINDWEDLKYKGTDGENIKEFLEAFINKDAEALSLLAQVSDPSVCEKYIELDIESYKIKKLFANGASRIIFEYSISAESYDAFGRTASGTHSFYVVSDKNGVYLEDVEKASLTNEEKFLSDYFSSTLEYSLLDCADLSYSQRTDITDFLIKRCSGTPTEIDLVNLAHIIFGVYNFTPSEELLTENGSYQRPNRGTRGLCFDIINQSNMFNEINLSVVLYADRSKLVPARTVEISLTDNGADFRFLGSYTSKTTDYKVFKVNETIR